MFLKSFQKFKEFKKLKKIMEPDINEVVEDGGADEYVEEYTVKISC